MTELFLATYVLLWALVLVMAVALFALYHHFGEIYLNSREGRETAGPEEEAPLPRLELEGAYGGGVEIPQLGRSSLVVFTDTTCRLCNRVKPQIEEFASENDEVATIVVCSGRPSEVREWADELPSVAAVAIDTKRRAAARCKIGVTPFVVAVDGDGITRAKGIVNDKGGLEWALELLELEVAAGRSHPREVTA